MKEINAAVQQNKTCWDKWNKAKRIIWKGNFVRRTLPKRTKGVKWRNLATLLREFFSVSLLLADLQPGKVLLFPKNNGN